MPSFPMDVRRVLHGTFGHVLQGEYNELIAGGMHRNQDEIYHGPGSARVILRRGDSHFWVI
jgi:hypothetical protein